MKYNNLHYNYILVSRYQSDYSIRYKDLNNTEYSKLILHNLEPKKLILSILYKIHTSNKINKFINIPFKRIWKYYWIFDIKNNIEFNNTNPICFIIIGRYFEELKYFYRDEFIQYIQNKYKNCKIILFLTDLIKSYSLNIERYRKQFDLIFSFDKQDSYNNNYIYYPDESFSSYPINKNPLFDQSDIVFIGKAKNRFDEIIKIFELLYMNNIKCDFHITEVPVLKQKYADKIIYNKPLPYHEVLQHVISSKCILEILVDGGSSPTARVSEAIFYGKKLLSNCQELSEKSYYNPKYISLFSNLEDIDISFIKDNIDIIDYDYKDKLSPLKLIEFIDSHLTN
jgi:hypothetical protein